MSDAPTPESTEDETPSGRGKLLKVLAIVAGLLVGAGSGVFLVGPLMAKSVTTKGPDTEKAAEKHGGKDEKGADGKGGTTKPVHVLDNLVLNPAGSGGTRFLLVTVAFEMKTAAEQEDLKSRDAEIRDAVLVTLGRRSVDQLTDMAERETLKEELRQVVDRLVGKGSVVRIYFPQFVIQ